jgi:alanyl-tRNA synthetase
MPATEKLYFSDSALLQFEATVIDVKPAEGGEAVVLDRTAFYPTGGGQPYDTGLLGDTRVVDVLEDDGGIISHVVREPGRLTIGSNVKGQIDRRRRLDHLQQHSGQHILSQAFVRACGAETRSFHLGATTSTIDIELQNPNEDHMRKAEDIANEIVFEDRPMRVHLVTEEEASSLPLRKESAIRDVIRVIEVEDFDWSPCGGTHAHSAGQVGLIAIKSFERAKQLTRVEFVCGGRALEEYRRAHRTGVTVAQLFSAERDQSPELVARALDENKALKKRIRDLIELAATAEAAQLLAVAPTPGPFKLVKLVFEGRELEEVRMLASKIVQSEPSVALLATRESGTARLVFARSQSLSWNMGALLAEACQALGGRGGGKPDLAQGGGPATEKVEDALDLAESRLT